MPLYNPPVTGSWTAYVPTVGSGTGTLTSASATGRYKLIGKTLYFNVTVTITTNGTGATSITFTLPNGLLATAVTVGNGRNATSAQPLEVVTAAASNLVTVLTTASVYPGADGTFLFCSGVTEIN